jgi:hypothetical protein
MERKKGGKKSSIEKERLEKNSTKRKGGRKRSRKIKKGGKNVSWEERKTGIQV